MKRQTRLRLDRYNTMVDLVTRHHVLLLSIYMRGMFGGKGEKKHYFHRTLYTIITLKTTFYAKNCMFSI